MFRKKNSIAMLIFAISLAALIFTGCGGGSGSSGSEPGGENTIKPENVDLSFEAGTELESWLTDGDIYAVGENGATDAAITSDSTVVNEGSASLKVSGTLPDSNSSYTYVAARFNLPGLFDYSTGQDFSNLTISTSIYIPSTAPAGGSIKLALYNADGDVLVSNGITSYTTDQWNEVSFDISEYVSGVRTWDYDSLGGSGLDAVYKYVTGISIELEYAEGPDTAYEYYLDGLAWTDPASITLKSLAEEKGMLIGVAVNPDYFSEAAYVNTIKREFNTVVAENDMKFSYIQYAEGIFSYTNADKLVNFAKENDMQVRGHAFLWHSTYQIPAWLNNKLGDDETANTAAVKAAIESHIENVMGHFEDDIYAWDVANEIIQDGSGTAVLRNRADASNYSVWAENSDDDSVIKAAFIKADAVRDELGDDVKLFLCDYSNESANSTKGEKFYTLVNDWVGEGVPIDGVAFQLHLSEDYTPDYAGIEAQVQRFQDLELEVQFTEIDVRLNVDNGGNVTSAQLQNQADIYAKVMEIALKYNVKTFITWGVTDKYSWIPGTFSGYGSGLIYDDTYNAKPAYTALKEELQK